MTIIAIRLALPVAVTTATGITNGTEIEDAVIVADPVAVIAAWGITKGMVSIAGVID